MERLGNDFATTLTAAITTVGQTAITVASGTGSPSVNFRVRIDDELILVTNKGGGTNWTIERGLEGTTAATHLNGADVVHVLTAGSLDLHAFENWVNRETIALNEDVTVLLNAQAVVRGKLRLVGKLRVKGTVAFI